MPTIPRLCGLLMLPVLIAAHPVPALAGSADRWAEDAAAAAKRDRNATNDLRKNRPPAHDRRALPGYEDALERAERRAEKSDWKAKNTAREAERASRQKKNSAKRSRKFKQRINERKERLRREIDG